MIIDATLDSRITVVIGDQHNDGRHIGTRW